MARNSVRLQLVLEGKDALRSLRAIEREYGSLEKAGVTSTRKINEGFKNNKRSSIDLENTIKKGLTGAFIGLGAIGIRELAQLATETFNIASAVEETEAKFSTSLGKSVAIATEFIEEYANALGLTNREAKDVLATQTNIARGLGFTGDEASKLAIDVARLAGDLSSFNNIPIEQTLNAIRGGLVGEREALKTLGIVVREADVQERALLNTRKQSTENLTAQEKALASFQIITESAGVAVGDLDRTLESPANKARRLGAEFRQLKDELAVGLLNSFDGVIDAGLQLTGVFDKLINDSPVESIKNEQIALNQLIGEIEDTNIGEAERVRLIQQLNIEYPDFLENLDAEKTTNEELSVALQKANKEYENRFLIQGELNDVIEAQSRLNKAQEQNEKTRSKLIKSIVDLRLNEADALKDLNAQIDINGSSTEELGDFLNEVSVAIRENITLEEARSRILQSVTGTGTLAKIATIDLENATNNYNTVLANAEDRLLAYGFSQERVNELLSEYADNQEGANSKTKVGNEESEKSIEILRQVALRYNDLKQELNSLEPPTFDFSTAFSVDPFDFSEIQYLNFEMPDISKPFKELDLSGLIILESSLQGLTNKINEYKEQQKLATSPEQYQALQDKINETGAQIQTLTGDAGLLSNEMLILNDVANSFTNSFGQGLSNVIVEGERLEDVLNNIGKLLLSSAIQKGLSILLTGGLSGEGFFGSGGGLFGKIGKVLGFADGVTNFGGGTALVGEEGRELITNKRGGMFLANSPQLLGLPPGSNVITNENTERLLSNANRISAPSISSFANNVTQNSVNNIQSKIDTSGMAKEISGAISNAMSGAVLKVGKTGELIVEFRKESRRLKELGSDDFIPFNSLQ